MCCSLTRVFVWCVDGVQPCVVVNVTTLQCVTSPGAGTQHIASLFVNDTLVQSTVGVQYISYAEPSLTSAATTTAPSSTSLATVGGDVIVITGTNLAPDCWFTALSFSASGATLTPTTCNVTTIVARTSAGAGVVGAVVALVGGQTATSVVSFSYSAPAITGLVCMRRGW